MSRGTFSPLLHYDNKPFSMLGQWDGVKGGRGGGSLWEEGTCWLLEKTLCTTTLRFLDIYFFGPLWLGTVSK